MHRCHRHWHGHWHQHVARLSAPCIPLLYLSSFMLSRKQQCAGWLQRSQIRDATEWSWRAVFAVRYFSGKANATWDLKFLSRSSRRQQCWQGVGLPTCARWNVFLCTCKLPNRGGALRNYWKQRLHESCWQYGIAQTTKSIQTCSILLWDHVHEGLS
jgi:hypothetical protein